jgi:hypothetical protein
MPRTVLSKSKSKQLVLRKSRKRLQLSLLLL